MSLIYIEYFSRRPGVDLDAFRAGVAEGQQGWDSGYDADRLVLNAGRTWRLGPEPEYFAAWHCPRAGLDRLDDWDRIFRGGEADHLEGAFFQVARIDVAGCYTPLIEPVHTRGGTYYVEFFRPRADGETISAFYEERTRRHPRLTLNLLLRRIGRLTPEPGGLAVWVLPEFAALEEIAGDLDGVDEPVELVTAGTYADFGREIL